MSCQIPTLDPHPGVCAAQIERYVSERLQASSINLYTAYLLKHEALRLERRCYIEPAWSGRLIIRGLLKIYYDYLTGTALKCPGEAAEAASWFFSDAPLLDERRPHFLVDRLPQGRSLLDDREFHELLRNLRQDERRLSDNDGPFPAEVFPWDHAAPEQEILHPGSEAAFHTSRALDAESENLYVCLQIDNT